MAAVADSGRGRGSRSKGKSSGSKGILPSAPKRQRFEYAPQYEPPQRQGATVVPPSVHGDPSNSWFVSEHRPSAAEVRAQLEALCRTQKSVTEVDAKRKMARAIDKVSKAGSKLGENASSTGDLDFRHQIEDGAASSHWAAVVARGGAIPAPFLVAGGTGRAANFSLSAVRMALSGAVITPPVSEVRAPPSGASAAGGGAAAASQSDSPEAPQPRSVFQFGLPENWSQEQGAEQFIEGMRPKSGTDLGTPPWIQQLLDGDLQAACDFWQ